MPGDEFPGSSPCERCQCSQGSVHCAQQRCEPRPGCKALHRPDHCCPTYQCECEKEGRVYGNGEKLVDPQDPCRVCYCQGGEVVCRRIACFVRDDCTPRLVPGRCCPEYDNCPLRGVTALPGMTSSIPIIPASSSDAGAVPAVLKEITIKEITHVSEIPIITDVKIKEILPSPGIEVAEYSSSKSPLIPREATSEKNTNTDFATPEPEQEMPSVMEVHSSPETVSTEQSITSTENKSIDARAPSKISLSTQDSINSEIYPSPLVPIIATMGSPYVTPQTQPVASTTKAPMVEEDDPSLFDHNPAFPPLPDDLSVLSNHGDEIVPEPSADSDHMLVEHAQVPQVIVPGFTTSTEAQVKEPLTTTSTYLPNTPVSNTDRSSEAVPESSTIPETTSTSASIVRENPTIKLRSAIPTETLSASPEEATVNEGKVTVTDSNLDLDAQKTTPLFVASSALLNTTTEAPKKYDATTKSEEITKSVEIAKSVEITTQEPEAPIERVSFLTTGADPEPETQSTTQKEIVSQKVIEYTSTEASSSTQDQTTSLIPKSNVATEVTSQTELSSLPIETSDQNPHESSASENVSKNTLDIFTADPIPTTSDKPAASSELITVAKANSRAIENVETTEFILTSFGSSESSTDAVELIKIPGDSDKNAAIIDSADGNKNALTDLIKLVSDVASISEHTDSPLTIHPVGSTSYSDSEELIPVNAGYKSKNNNFNQNSITEVPFKSKGVLMNKQKGVEIEDDESAGITDSLPPNDKVEPTTRRPIIDNVSDDMPANKTEKKDIEIITQSYVPTINRRPTKVILKEDSTELTDELSQDDASASASSEMTTEGVTSRDSDESVTGSSVELSTAAPLATTEAANDTLSAAK
ncbi:Kielin/chordin-like protein [Operophtera brumata]|uniref:Kielin/chordin-like protein n=1 Tax=Operophtera brumata TaxID=104452 RepID=A0A0L7KPJ7_OPEBR|nr:Kielin/chordin-like protein [Operophtera brumata]